MSTKEEPRWEDELIAGQASQGESGGLEADLAMVHLLRHAREPEALSPAALDGIWGDISAEVTPAPWWRRQWWAWAVPAFAGAAALVVILLPPGGEQSVAGIDPVEDTGGASQEPSADGGQGLEDGGKAPRIASRSAQAELIEQQFAALSAQGHVEVDASVDNGRSAVRLALVDNAKEANR